MITLAHQWRCLDPGCDDAGTGPDSDRAAEKHLRATGHGVTAWAEPQEWPQEGRERAVERRNPDPPSDATSDAATTRTGVRG